MAGVKQGRDGAVGTLTLNEPESLNAMTPDLLGALAKAFNHVERTTATGPGSGSLCPRHRAPLISAAPHGATRMAVIATVDTTRSHAGAPVRDGLRLINA